MIKLKKTAGTIGAILGIFCATALIAYAITTLFTSGNTYNSNIRSRDIFEITDVNPFSGEISLAPGESMDINPVITSNATADMYVFMKVVMPTVSGSGLYTFNTSWEKISSYEENGAWVEVYGYSGVLSLGQSTGTMCTQATMKEIGVDVYAGLDDLNFSMTAYAYGFDEQEYESAWNDIREVLGV